MPRRSRYPGSKGIPQGKGRRPGRTKPLMDRPSVPIESRQPDMQGVEPPPSSSSVTVQKNFTPPPFILREIKLTAIIAGALLILLVILSLVL